MFNVCLVAIPRTEMGSEGTKEAVHDANAFHVGYPCPLLPDNLRTKENLSLLRALSRVFSSFF
jgi:hypothetical protein